MVTDGIRHLPRVGIDDASLGVVGNDESAEFAAAVASPVSVVRGMAVVQVGVAQQRLFAESHIEHAQGAFKECESDQG